MVYITLFMFRFSVALSPTEYRDEAVEAAAAYLGAHVEAAVQQAEQLRALRRTRAMRSGVRAAVVFAAGAAAVLSALKPAAGSGDRPHF